MDLGLVGSAAGMFAVTNIDDLLVLTLFFGQSGRNRRATARVVAGQYFGFTLILVASLVGAFGASLLTDEAVSYLGVVPLGLGLRAAWHLRTHKDDFSDERGTVVGCQAAPQDVRVWQVAAVTFANGGDNLGVYIPVFASAGTSGMTVYSLVFMLGVAVWCALGHYLASRPLVARTLSRWGHVLTPVVFVAIGLLILVDGGAFGL